jgi:hypothetical protein
LLHSCWCCSTCRNPTDFALDRFWVAFSVLEHAKVNAIDCHHQSH